MKKNTGLQNLNIGLVLAGGGAKGAYEVGVFKCLFELDLVNHIRVISGTSVGAFNAALLTMNDISMINDVWHQISYSKLLTNPEDNNNHSIPHLLEKVKQITLSDLSTITKEKVNEHGFLSLDAICKFIEECVDTTTFASADKDVYICTYNIDEGKPDYFQLNNQTKEDIINLISASCAIPFLFKPVIINGQKFADGGIRNPIYAKNNTDNVPIAPLTNYQCDLIIVVHLSYKDKVNKTPFKNSKIIEIYPSTPLEIINGAGSLNLHHNTLTEHIELGYRDAMIILAPMLLKILQGESIDALIATNDKKNEALLYL